VIAAGSPSPTPGAVTGAAPAPVPAPAIEAIGVSVTIGGRTILDRCDLAVPSGGWVTIVGPNGAGKTTLLQALAGLVPATGRIALHGAPLSGLSHRQRARTVALVPQSPVLPPAMTVGHYVLLGRTAHLGPLGRESVGDLDVVDRALEQLDLGGFADRALGTLSGGERQRALVARGLAQEASILVLDEPTTALDIAHQQDTLELVDRLRRRLGLTVLTTMHDLTLAAQYADHLVVLARGEVVVSGPPADVLTSAQLHTHYGAHVDVILHRGRLVVVPWRPDTDLGASSSGGT
jgi:iron complex transport system ATP-binding protein